MRKTIIPLLLLCSVTTALFGQQDTCLRQAKPLSEKAFAKMMTDYFNFSLLGTQTPSTGFKVETSKPTITLKGNVFTNQARWLVVNLELTGGVQDDLMQVFSGNKLNGYFKANAGVNFLWGYGNRGWYNPQLPLQHMATRKTVCHNRESIAKQMDTFQVISALVNFGDLRGSSYEDVRNVAMNNSNLSKNQISGFSRNYTPDQKAYYTELLRGTLVKYGAVDSANCEIVFNDFKNKITDSADALLKTKIIIADLQRLKPFSLEEDKKYLEHLQQDFEIETYKEIWNWKSVAWFNISVSSSNATFKLLDPTINNTHDSSSFLPGITASVNWLLKGRKASRYQFYKFGVAYQKVNNLSELDKFDYKKETTINTTGGEQLKDTKQGTAYKGELDQGFGADVFLEAYIVPWNKEFVPGLYLKPKYSYGDPWLNKNKLSLDVGMIWNVANNDKDSKNVLSIIPYVSWSNFIKEYKDIAKTEERKLSDLFSVGLKFGIPVNVGK